MLVLPVGDGPNRGFGFREKLVVCKSCDGSGLTDIQPNNVLAKTKAVGPFICRACKGTGVNREIRDPRWEVRQEGF